MQHIPSSIINGQNKNAFRDTDPTASSRKKDHIELAFKSQIQNKDLDTRFYYEPILAPHPKAKSETTFDFLNKTFKVPMWVSSMTGGTAWAATINHNLARAAQEFGFGMGLGSCRSLLTDDTYLKDFAVRPILGDDLPLDANLGIAQLEQLIASNELYLVKDLLDKLEADGLIIHVNPMQEWLQPEGDHFTESPLVTINRMLEAMPDTPFIVKEVGQGMGYESLKALLKLPLAAIDFAAHGGSNFAKLELLRSDPQKQAIYAALARVGHSAEDMTNLTNRLVEELGEERLCKEIIISGGVKDFLDGYYLVQKSKLPAIYGQASAFLRHARGTYEELQAFVRTQVEGYQLASNYLKVR